MITSEEINILLIEDNDGDIRLIREALGELDLSLTLTVSKDGDAASEKLHSGKQLDFIILDLNIPGKNGREMLEEIKADSNLKYIPVVILSSSDSEDDIFHAYQAHANCFIQKSISLELFTNTIQTMANFWFKIVKLPTKII